MTIDPSLAPCCVAPWTATHTHQHHICIASLSKTSIQLGSVHWLHRLALLLVLLFGSGPAAALFESPPPSHMPAIVETTIDTSLHPSSRDGLHPTPHAAAVGRFPLRPEPSSVVSDNICPADCEDSLTTGGDIHRLVNDVAAAAAFSPPWKMSRPRWRPTRRAPRGEAG